MNDGFVDTTYDADAAICNTGSTEFTEHCMALGVRFVWHVTSLELFDDSRLLFS